MDTEVQSDVHLKELKKLNCVNKKNEINIDPITAAGMKMGGRLQFFKDGKFIFELARSKVGDKFGWVSVPKKVTSLSTQNTLLSKNESCTSLSDDNSSIQSTSWQREPIWRKSVPRKNISKEMNMIFKRPKYHYINHQKVTNSLRRRPYNRLNNTSPFNNIEQNNDNTTKNIQNRIKGQSGNKIKSRKKLPQVIKNLIEKMDKDFEHLLKNSLNSKINNNLTANAIRLIDNQYQSNVSPRKRILKELEKVTLEDNTKRSRPKNETCSINNKSNMNTFAVNKKDQTGEIDTNRYVNNSRPTKNNSTKNQANKCCTIPTSAKLYSSYSIHSLLGNVNKKNESLNNLMSQESRSSSENSVFTTPVNKISPNSSQHENNCDIHDLTTNIKSNYEQKDSLNDNTNLEKLNYMTENNSFSAEFVNQNCTVSKNKALELTKKNVFTSRISMPNYGSDISGTSTEFNCQTKDKSDYNSLSIKSENIEETQHSKSNFHSNMDDNNVEINSSKNNLCHSVHSAVKISQRNAHAHSKSSFLRNEHKGPDNYYAEQTIKENSDIPMSAVCPPGYLGAHNTISPAALYYMYPENSTITGSQNNNTSYVQPCTYFHPYAALRDPLWLHYQSSLTLPAPIARLPTNAFQFNRISTHLITNRQDNADKKPDVHSAQDDCSLDMPLNLSKH